jgi:hypothetical protein
MSVKALELSVRNRRTMRADNAWAGRHRPWRSTERVIHLSPEPSAALWEQVKVLAR